jgi:hypothetical protein
MTPPEPCRVKSASLFEQRFQDVGIRLGLFRILSTGAHFALQSRHIVFGVLLIGP